MKNIIKVLLVFFTLNGILYSQTPQFLGSDFRSLNYQCAGFVTAVFPANNGNNLSSQRLYAKTDIGGIYRSDNNGQNWTLISNYPLHNNSRAFSEYINAGLAVHPTDPDQLIVAWGFFSGDAAQYSFKCLYQSSNGGNSWSPCDIPSPGILFNGDYLPTKVGGECVIYDPRQGQSDRVFAGGIDPSGNDPHLYMSSNNGASFIDLSSPQYNIFLADVGDTISCIAMHSGSNRNEIYVGTSSGIYRSPGFNGNYPQPFVKLPDPSTFNGFDFSLHDVRRILIKDNGLGYSEKIYCAFGMDWNYSVNYNSHIMHGGGILSYDPSNQSAPWADLTPSFEEPGNPNSNPNNDPLNYFSLLTWADDAENWLIAGRLNRPTRKTSNGGINWSGESNDWDQGFSIRFQYDQNSISTYPNHQFSNAQNYDEFQTYMYGGLNFLVRNSNTNCSDCGNTWYLSGGAGLRISDNLPPTTNSGETFAEKKWHYSTTNQSMPVIYDFTFEISNNVYPMTYIPMADWTMAYLVYWDPDKRLNDYSPLNYDNQNTRYYALSTYYNTYASNVTRTLIAKHPTNSGERWTYNIGADTYIGGTAVMYKRRQLSDGSIITERCTNSNPDYILNRTGYAILDGLIFDYNTNLDKIVILVGTQDYSYPTTYSGIYFTTDGGNSFSQSTINLTNAVIPSLKSNPATGYLYSDQFNFALAPKNNPFLYVYLEGSGLYLSTDGGESWTNSISQPTTTFGSGCLKYVFKNKLLLAIKNVGLFLGTINSDGTIGSWTNINNYSSDQFTSASQIETKDDYWVVFGTKYGDVFPRLYSSSDAGVNWTAFADGLRGVRALRIHPQTFELFIATTGLGTIIYRGLNTSYPFIISNTYNISDSSYFQQDIQVDSGGVLNITGNITLKMAPDKRIYVNEGGKLIANNVEFNCEDSTQKWAGIYFENSEDSCSIQNCIFNNATLPIKIDNDEDFALNNIFIKNNTFNCQYNGDYVIYSENDFNLIIQGNQFNMPEGSSNKTGLYVKNNMSIENPENPAIIKIIGNTFNDGIASMILTSYASERTSYYISRNTFTGNSVQYNLLGRMMTGRIRNNNFSSSGTANPVYLDQSNPDFYKNTINGDGTSIVLDAHSFANLAPSIDGSYFYWYGGQNQLNSVNAGNIVIADEGDANTNYGYNIFSKNSNDSYYHISGIFDSTKTWYEAKHNGWCPTNIPYNYLWSSINPAINTYYYENFTNCNNNEFNPRNSVVQLVNKGQGIYDTVFRSPISSAEPDPSQIIYAQAIEYYNANQYLNAIINYKNLIDDYSSSPAVSGGAVLYDLYDSYEALDTGSEQTYTDYLYSDLENYLNAKIQSLNYGETFNDIAYYLINLCQANEEEYYESLTGFQFIAMFHPDAEIRLLASWDASEVEDLMGQSGGEGKVISEIKFKEHLVKELVNMIAKDSTMKIMKRIFDVRNKAIENNMKSYNNTNNSTQNIKKDIPKTNSKSLESINEQKINKNKKITENSKNDSKEKLEIKSSNTSKKKTTIDFRRRAELIAKAESNLRMAKSWSKDEKQRKQREDLLLLAGYHSKSQNIDNNSGNLPTSYNLSQNYPNPFNPVTKINYELPQDGKVKLIIYDILGREVKSLVNEFKSAGKYSIEFNGSYLSSGIYFYRIEINNFVQVKKMVLVK